MERDAQELRDDPVGFRLPTHERRPYRAFVQTIVQGELGECRSAHADRSLDQLGVPGGGRWVDLDPGGLHHGLTVLITFVMRTPRYGESVKSL